MQVSLQSLVSHDSFNWRCRGNKTALLKILVVVVLQLFGISEVDSSVSSSLFKATTKIYDLAKKPKNVRQGLECFLKSEATVLKKSNKKDTQEKCIAEMKEKNSICKERPSQDVKETSSNFVAHVTEMLSLWSFLSSKG